MRRGKILTIVLFPLLLTAILPGCDLLKSLGGDVAGFYNSVKDSAPAILATISAATRDVTAESRGWTSTTAITYYLFNMFQEYEYPRDEGIVDTSNMYKLLFEAGNNYEQAERKAVGLSAPTAIASPFNFGTPALTYTHAYESGAYKKDGDTTYALLPFTWGDPAVDPSYGVIEGSFNETTGDVSLQYAYMVDYATGEIYPLRTEISGNATEHRFTIKAAGTYMSVLGTGVSQSDSADDYYLFKVQTDTGASYYKFKAGSTEDDFEAYQETGYAAADIDDPKGYIAVLDAMTFLDPATTLPSAPTDFANGNKLSY